MTCGDWAVVAGTALGITGTLGSTILAHFLTNQKQARIDKARKRLLRKALTRAGNTGWMSVETLAHIIGSDLDTTRTLLIEIEARGSMRTDKEMWSLISRNALPTGPNAE
ncbi:hypothetical protein [Ruegeria arenilitoris]|uniref:hypothetical protein n=1 Tax=Ruegeria arenilitoris TaxID=1173585 RepID=UPI00147E7656|nr:hypothetical protein [Ruegeria arenilitoris]